MKSIADILKSEQYKEIQSKAAKYVKHEFQDYGLRLANDLGDIQNKHIYLKLAKKYPRHLLEQAAAFALGYDKEPSKGRLFMWKLKEINRERELKDCKVNFNFDHIQKWMGGVFNSLSNSISIKQSKQMNLETTTLLSKIGGEVLNMPKIRGKRKLLIIDSGAGYEQEWLDELGIKTYGYSMSKKLAKIAKTRNQQLCISKPDFFKNAYKDDFFDSIYIQRFWEYIPLEEEEKFLLDLFRMLKNGGNIFLNYEFKDIDDQSWKDFFIAEKQDLRFEKSSTIERFSQILYKHNYKLISVMENLYAIQPGN